MTRARERLAAAALAVALVGAAAPPLPRSAETPFPGYSPAPERASIPLTTDGSWVVEEGPVVLRLAPLDVEERRAYLQRRAGIRTDPFATRAGADRPAFLTFHLVLVNRSAGTVAYQPLGTWLKTNGNEVQLPLDLTAMESEYRLRDARMPPAYRLAAKALLDGSKLLAPGERIEGLLVFPAFKKKAKSFEVRVEMIGGTGEPLSYRAAYVRDRKRRSKE